MTARSMSFMANSVALNERSKMYTLKVEPPAGKLHSPNDKATDRLSADQAGLFGPITDIQPA